MSLGALIEPCGPVVDGDIVEAAFGMLGAVPAIASAWPALAPVVAASPYLAKLMLSGPERLGSLLDSDPGAAIAGLVAAAHRAPAGAPLPSHLRRLKAELHLLVALCDLGGVWDLDAVTAALSDFADAAVEAALASAVEAERAAGKLKPAEPGAPGLAGFFVLALGKHGARRAELLLRHRRLRLLRPRPPAGRARASSPRRWRCGSPRPWPRRCGEAHGRGLCLPRRPAAAARPVLHPRRRAGGRGARLLRERRPELGAGGDDQGAGLRRATWRPGRPSWPSCSPSSGAATSTTRPSPTSTRSSARSTFTRGSTTGGAAGRAGRRPQARRRRHPRDRVLRPDPAADPAAAATRPCAARAPSTPWQALAAPAMSSPPPPRTWRSPTTACAPGSTACRCSPTTRPTACRSTTPSGDASPPCPGSPPSPISTARSARPCTRVNAPLRRAVRRGRAAVLPLRQPGVHRRRGRSRRR